MGVIRTVGEITKAVEGVSHGGKYPKTTSKVSAHFTSWVAAEACACLPWAACELACTTHALLAESDPTRLQRSLTGPNSSTSENALRTKTKCQGRVMLRCVKIFYINCAHSC